MVRKDAWNDFDFFEFIKVRFMAQKVCHSFPSKEQASFNFMAAVTVHRDFGAQESKTCHCFHFPPSICRGVMRPDAMILVF